MSVIAPVVLWYCIGIADLFRVQGFRVSLFRFFLYLFFVSFIFSDTLIIFLHMYIERIEALTP